MQFGGENVGYVCVDCSGDLEYDGKNENGGKVWHCMKCNRKVSEFDIYLKQHSTEL